MSTNDKRLAADIAATSKKAVEPTLSDLRTRDEAIAALAAECAALKAASDQQRKFILNGVEFGYIRLPDHPDPAIATHAQCLEGIKTPATDAFINAVRAEGAEEYKQNSKRRFISLPAGDTVNCEPTRYLPVDEVVALLQQNGFAVEVEQQS